MAQYIIETHQEVLTEYEISRKKTPETIVMGVTAIGYNPSWQFAPPIQIKIAYGLGREYTNIEEVAAILKRGEELGMNLKATSKEEALPMLSIDPSLGKQALVAERLSNLCHTPDDGDETPFTR